MLTKTTNDGDLVWATTLARWTDQRFLDPLVGLLLPGVGDLLGALVGLTIVVIAIKKKTPAVVVARMLLNLGVDALVGAVPLVGDVFDFTFHANTRNVALLRTSQARTGGRRLLDWLIVGGAVAAFLLALALPLFIAVFAIRALEHHHL